MFQDVGKNEYNKDHHKENTPPSELYLYLYFKTLTISHTVFF